MMMLLALPQPGPPRRFDSSAADAAWSWSIEPRLSAEQPRAADAEQVAAGVRGAAIAQVLAGLAGDDDHGGSPRVARASRRRAVARRRAAKHLND